MHYTGLAIRPPYGAGSVMLEVTVGGARTTRAPSAPTTRTPFRLAPREQVRTDLPEIARLRPGADHIWAAGGNPFSMSTRKLLALYLHFKKQRSETPSCPVSPLVYRLPPTSCLNPQRMIS